MEPPPPPPPNHPCSTDQVIFVFLDDEDGGYGPLQVEGYDDEIPSWLRQLVAEDFSKRCVGDRTCSTCGGRAFCGHCCGEHHQCHDTAAVKKASEEEKHRMDSFCIGCRAAFCSELCAHHGGGEGHEVVRVDEYGDRHFVRCTGSEPWFYAAFDGIETFEDEDGNLMVPLERKRTDSLEPAPGLKHTTRHLR